MNDLHPLNIAVVVLRTATKSSALDVLLCKGRPRAEVSVFPGIGDPVMWFVSKYGCNQCGSSA
jgi:hypothetical protein